MAMGGGAPGPETVIGTGRPAFSELCSPLETRTLVFDKSSILIAFCPAIEQSNPTLIGTLGRDFWKGLVGHHELHFLVPDMGELTGRG